MPNRADHRTRLGEGVPLALALGGLLGLAAIGPALSTGGLPGRAFVDAHGTQWWYWAVSQPSPGALLRFPDGVDLFAHTGLNVVDALLAMLPRALFGPRLGYALFVAAIYGSNSAATAVLARSFGADRAGQVLAGLLLTSAPFLSLELEWGRPTQALVAFLPLALAAVRSGRPVWGGLALALAGYTYWYAGLLGAFGVAAVGLGDHHNARTRLLHTTVALAVAAALVSPAVLAMGLRLSHGAVPGLLAVGGGPHHGVWAHTVEGSLQTLWVLAPGGMAGGLLTTFEPSARLVGPVHVGLLLASVIVLRRRAAVPLAWIALGVGVALGPRWSPLYAWAVHGLDLLRRWWWPVRAVVWIDLGVALLAGLAVSRLRRGRWVLWSLLIVQVGLGHLPLSAWQPTDASLLTRCIDHSSGEAVFTLPTSHAQAALWLQTHHGQPILSGMNGARAGFQGATTERWLAEVPLLAEAKAVAGGATSTGRRKLSELDGTGIGTLVLRRDAVDPGIEGELKHLLGPPSASDPHLWIWAHAPLAARCRSHTPTRSPAD